jgi:hypothetical protein
VTAHVITNAHSPKIAHIAKTAPIDKHQEEIAHHANIEIKEKLKIFFNFFSIMQLYKILKKIKN